MSRTGHDSGHHASSAGKTGPLLFGRVLDGIGGGRKIGWEDAAGWKPEKIGEVLWVQLQRDHPAARDWLTHGLELPDATIALLLSDEARPCAFREKETLITVLRGVNTLGDETPDNTVLMQLWSDGERVVTLDQETMSTLRQVKEDLDQKIGPTDAGALITTLVKQIINRMSRAILEMDDEIDRLEQEDMQKADTHELLARIGDIRRNCLSLERHMGPQHDALDSISTDAPSWFEDNDRSEVVATIHRLRRYLDDIDISKESAVVLMDELRGRTLARTRHTNFVISVLTGIFLPLTFLTGLLGINVAGIPGAKDPDAFWYVVLFCAGIFGSMVMVIWRSNLFRDSE
ncbi:MAG: CorA family divalent cation transporter [Sphingomonadaceae bacterium]